MNGLQMGRCIVRGLKLLPRYPLVLENLSPELLHTANTTPDLLNSLLVAFRRRLIVLSICDSH